MTADAHTFPDFSERERDFSRVDKHRLVTALSRALPAHGLLHEPEDLRPYECDGMSALRQLPLVVALPDTEAQVVEILRICAAQQVPVVARGAGTGLSGGALPHRLGVTLSLAKFNKILKLDKYSRTAIVQCGVRNLAISEAAAPLGLYYAPDPSSQIACSIGGNVAENSGGVHCLKYGLTLHNVLRVRAVLMNGEVVEIDPVGVRVRLHALVAPAENESAVLVARGRYRFVLHAPDAQEVVLLADFLDWDPSRGVLAASGDGHFEGTFEVPAGRHRYRMLVDGVPVTPPANAHVDDGFGGLDAVLTVE